MGPHVRIVKKTADWTNTSLSAELQVAVGQLLERGGVFAPMAHASLFLGSYPASQTYMGQHGGIVSQPINYLIGPCKHIVQIVWYRKRAQARSFPGSLGHYELIDIDSAWPPSAHAN
jgi:hypothetical protein